MRAVLTALALVLLATCVQADILPDTWLRGASSSAVNDDATAVFVNPAGLGLYEETGSWTSLTMTGEDIQSYSFALKAGGIGFGSVSYTHLRAHET